MNPTIIIFKGKEYPTRFGFRVIEKWETEAGFKISQIGKVMQGDNVGAAEMITIMKLAYYAIESGLKREGLPVEFTLDDFIEDSELSDFEAIIQVVMGGISPKTENKRQPTKKQS